VSEPAIPAGDARALARALVRIDSRNPGLTPGGAGELVCVTLLRRVLDDWGFRTEVHEALPDRPNLLARIGKAEAPRRLMFSGHLDVVGVEGMTHAPFDGEERDGRLYARGACDMKGGVAAMCAAAWRAAQQPLGGAHGG
jgi:acetylornithine deacetylase/succinyl-diaminopimelate desuccinylase-like protein